MLVMSSVCSPSLRVGDSKNGRWYTVALDFAAAKIEGEEPSIRYAEEGVSDSMVPYTATETPVGG